MLEQTTTVMAIVPIPVVLGLGWAVGAGLFLGGLRRGTPRLTGVGLVVLGLMTLATPLSFYAYLAWVNGGSFDATIVDVLTLAFLAFLGGSVAVAGVLTYLVSGRASRPTSGKR